MDSTLENPKDGTEGISRREAIQLIGTSVLTPFFQPLNPLSLQNNTPLISQEAPGSPFQRINTSDGLYSQIDLIEGMEIFQGDPLISTQTYDIRRLVTGDESDGEKVDVRDINGVIGFVNPLGAADTMRNWDELIAASGAVEVVLQDDSSVEAHWNSDKIDYGLIAESNDSRATWIEAASAVQVLINIAPSKKLLIMGNTVGIPNGIGALFGNGTSAYYLDESEEDLKIYVADLSGVPAVIQNAEFSLPSIQGGDETLSFKIERMRMVITAYPGGGASLVSYGGSTNFRIDTPQAHQTAYGVPRPQQIMDAGIKLSPVPNGLTPTYFAGVVFEQVNLNSDEG